MYKSVISIVTWNSEQYLKKCIDACLAQSGDNIRIVVVDNNSTDGTRAIIKSYGDLISSILSNKNTGFSGGHNLAISNYKAEYYCVLNPDVFLDVDYIKNAIKFLDIEQRYGGCIGKVFQCLYKDGNFEGTNIIDTCGLGIKRSYHFFAIDNGLPDTQNSNKDIFGVDGMCPVYRGTMLEDIIINDEYFDEYFFAYCEDQDLSWRAANKGWKFAFVHQARAFHIRTWKPATLKGRRAINKEIKKMALRNHYLMLVRNLSFSKFIKGSPFILFRMSKIFIYCLLFEKYSLRAFSEVISNFKKYYRMRNFINQ